MSSVKHQGNRMLQCSAKGSGGHDVRVMPKAAGRVCGAFAPAQLVNNPVNASSPLSLSILEEFGSILEMHDQQHYGTCITQACIVHR